MRPALLTPNSCPPSSTHSPWWPSCRIHCLPTFSPLHPSFLFLEYSCLSPVPPSPGEPLPSSPDTQTRQSCFTCGSLQLCARPRSAHRVLLQVQELFLLPPSPASSRLQITATPFLKRPELSLDPMIASLYGINFNPLLPCHIPLRHIFTHLAPPPDLPSKPWTSSLSETPPAGGTLASLGRRPRRRPQRQAGVEKTLTQD